MTNHWIDLQYADVILIMGSNAAENHPISFHWVTRGIEKGATLINVDPRFTKTSSKAHTYASIRSGTDIAFLGGMTKYIIENKLYNEAYMKLYTDAAFLVDPADSRAMGGVILSLITQPDLAAQMRSRGLARSRAFSWRHTAEKTLAAYERLLSSG